MGSINEAASKAEVKEEVKEEVKQESCDCGDCKTETDPMEELKSQLKSQLKAFVDKLTEKPKRIEQDVTEKLGISSERMKEITTTLYGRMSEIKSNLDAMIIVNEIVATKEEAAFLAIGTGMWLAS